MPAEAGVDVAAQAGPAERALPDTYQFSRQLGAAYIGPEHTLQGLATHAESSAGRPGRRPEQAGRRHWPRQPPDA